MFKCVILVVLLGVQFVVGQCPPDGIGYLPHETLCNSYYFCTTGAPTLRVCPGNMHWDNERRVCAHPDSFQCFLRDLRCPEITDPMDMVFLSNELDCTRYAICLNGVSYQQICVGGNYWNPDLEACSSPDLSQCVTTTTEPPPPTPVEVTCPSNVGLFYIPHPSRCEYYFVCSSGTPHFRSCAPGLFFDSVNEWCDLQENGVCAQDQTTLPPTTSTTPAMTTTPQSTTTTLAPTTTPELTTTATMETTTLETTTTTASPDSDSPDLIVTTVDSITTTDTPDVPTTKDPNDGSSSVYSGQLTFVLSVVLVQILVWLIRPSSI